MSPTGDADEEAIIVTLQICLAERIVKPSRGKACFPIISNFFKARSCVDSSFIAGS
jgi:hypothetical protein